MYDASSNNEGSSFLTVMFFRSLMKVVTGALPTYFPFANSESSLTVKVLSLLYDVRLMSPISCLPSRFSSLRSAMSIFPIRSPLPVFVKSALALRSTREMPLLSMCIAFRSAWPRFAKNLYLALRVLADNAKIPWNMKFRLGSLQMILPSNESDESFPTAAIFV